MALSQYRPMVPPMASCPFGAKQLSETILTYRSCHPWEQITRQFIIQKFPYDKIDYQNLRKFMNGANWFSNHSDTYPLKGDVELTMKRPLIHILFGFFFSDS